MLIYNTSSLEDNYLNAFESLTRRPTVPKLLPSCNTDLGRLLNLPQNVHHLSRRARELLSQPLQFFVELRPDANLLPSALAQMIQVYHFLAEALELGKARDSLETRKL